jgi:hypothetical protein
MVGHSGDQRVPWNKFNSGAKAGHSGSPICDCGGMGIAQILSKDTDTTPSRILPDFIHSAVSWLPRVVPPVTMSSCISTSSVSRCTTPLPAHYSLVFASPLLVASASLAGSSGSRFVSVLGLTII